MRKTEKKYAGFMVRKLSVGLAKALYNKGKEIYFCYPECHEISEAYGFTPKDGGDFDSLRAYYVELYDCEPTYKYRIVCGK